MRAVRRLYLLFVLCCPLAAQTSQWGQLATTARQLHDQGKYAQELPVAQEALRVAETLFGAESRQASVSQNALAMSLKELDRLADAETCFRRALAIDQKLLGPDDLEVASILTNLGVLYTDMGRLREARDLLERGLAIRARKLAPDDPSIGNSAGNLAVVSLAQGKYAEAESFERRSLAIDEKTSGPDSVNVAIDLNNLGEACSRQGRYKEAEPFHARALSIHLKLFGKDHATVASDLNSLGGVYEFEGRFPLSEASFRRALEIDEKAAAGKGVAISADLNNLAGLLSQQARFAEAGPLYLRALSIDEKALGTEHPAVASIHGNLAALLSTQGRYDAAESEYRRALAIREKKLGPEHPGVALILRGMALLRREQGRLPEAETLYRRALAIDEKALGPEHPEVARILNGLGGVYLVQAQVPLAAPLFRRALAIDEKTLGPAHPDVAADLLNLADVYAAGDHAEESGPLYQRVIAIEEKAFGLSGYRVAGPLLALATLRQRQAKFAEAEQLGKRALAILEAIAGPDSAGARSAYGNLATTYYGSGRLDLAATYFEKDLANLARQFEANFDYMNERERLQFLATAQGTFPLFVSFAAANRQRDPALAAKLYDTLLWEKGLVASNSAALRARILDSGDRAALGLFDQLTAKRAQLAALATSPGDDAAQWRESMAQLDREASSIETDLVKRSTALAETKASARVTWRDVQKGLKPDDAAVEYVRFQIHDGGGWTHAFAYAAVCLTSSAAPKVVMLGNALKLEAEPVTAYRAGVARTRGVSAAPARTSPSPSGDAGTGEAYNAFWKPLEEALGSAKRVYVAADGILNQVPIGLFADSSGKLLLEKYDVRIVNSTKDLLRPQRPPGTKTAVVMGNPAFDLTESAQREALSKLTGEAPAHAATPSAQQNHPAGANRLPPLPATQAEVQAVALSLKNAGWQVALYTGGVALEEVLGHVRNPKVVHLATHGFFLANRKAENGPGTAARPAVDDPMLRSGLYFAGADRARAGDRPAADLEDGVLTAYEATQLHLQGTELVVLSACETGLGQQANGEGVFGLRRGLQEAGAQSVLMSMWPVPDQETQELMALFYRQWLGGLDAHEALRQAQLQERDTVRLRYGHDLPYYWGAFVLVGP